MALQASGAEDIRALDEREGLLSLFDGNRLLTQPDVAEPDEGASGQKAVLLAHGAGNCLLGEVALADQRLREQAVLPTPPLLVFIDGTSDLGFEAGAALRAERG